MDDDIADYWRDITCYGNTSCRFCLLTNEDRSYNTESSQPTNALVTTGPYRFTRNPIYLGFLLIYLGFTFLAGSLWGIVISPFLVWTVTHAIIHAEEEYLEKKFEDQYREYSSQVRRWIWENFIGLN